MTVPRPESWVCSTPAGLYVEPGDFYVDPARGVDRSVVTHGHSDHARGGSRKVLTTPGTAAIMRLRLGGQAGVIEEAEYGTVTRIGEVDVTLRPAGHVLGSAQVVLDYRGSRVVVSGDFKRVPDPTCLPFEPVHCDVFITEATFGLPVFRHPPSDGEIDKLIQSVRLFPERAHVVGVYALGKCQRVLALLRKRGYDEPVYMHGALLEMTKLYAQLGVDLGPVLPALGVPKEALKGKIVLAPPSALSDLWSRRLPEPLIAMASGWMRVKQRAKQRGIELPLVISDHADWDELIGTIRDTKAPDVWVTHGNEEALVRQAELDGRRARALSLVGYEDDET